MPSRNAREIEQHYDLQVLRLFMLSAHYRSPLNFSDRLMESAKSSLERIRNAVDNLNFRIENANAEAMSADEKEKVRELAAFTQRFDDAMEDDINTADALSVVFDLVRFANSDVKEDSSKEFCAAVKEEILLLGDLLGMQFERKEEVLDLRIEDLIKERQAARKAKNFARADEIRDELAGMGITLLDTREGVKWKRN